MAGYVYRGTQFDVPTKPKKKQGRPFDPAYCGEMRGYKQHLRHNIPTCAPCRKACAESMAERRRLAAENDDKTGFDPSKCGSVKDYSQHRNHGVPACDDCRHANADDCRERRNAKK